MSITRRNLIKNTALAGAVLAVPFVASNAHSSVPVPVEKLTQKQAQEIIIDSYPNPNRIPDFDLKAGGRSYCAAWLALADISRYGYTGGDLLAIYGIATGTLHVLAIRSNDPDWIGKPDTKMYRDFKQATQKFGYAKEASLFEEV